MNCPIDKACLYLLSVLSSFAICFVQSLTTVTQVLFASDAMAVGRDVINETNGGRDLYRAKSNLGVEQIGDPPVFQTFYLKARGSL